METGGEGGKGKGEGEEERKIAKELTKQTQPLKAELTLCHPHLLYGNQEESKGLACSLLLPGGAGRPSPCADTH